MISMLQIAGLVKESIVDGPGFRFVVFTQGCKHHCPGCHNPHTHSFEGGTSVSVDSLLEQILKNPLLDGITLSGGEPFEQAGVCAELAAKVHASGLNVMTYTGYTVEVIQNSSREGWRSLLGETDILVDGRFELDKKNLLLKFKGSENQRIIDVKKTLRDERVVLAEI
ncbi:MAG: anaerobic ribonucleoside-triphosphate reductase activating protein [Ruminiclostridium sp.]|nr:anaerobic ribonucleoside-triphosphate reductase activating protein [Ruminiclostridium sp.]